MQVTLVQGPNYVFHQQYPVLVLSYKDVVFSNNDATRCTVYAVCAIAVSAVTRYPEPANHYLS